MKTLALWRFSRAHFSCLGLYERDNSITTASDGCFNVNIFPSDLQCSNDLGRLSHNRKPLGSQIAIAKYRNTLLTSPARHANQEVAPHTMLCVACCNVASTARGPIRHRAPARPAKALATLNRSLYRFRD